MTLGSRAIASLGVACMAYASAVSAPMCAPPVVTASLHPEWHKTAWPPVSAVVATDPVVPRDVPKPVKRFYSALG
jgi:hypothetical protein